MPPKHATIAAVKFKPGPPVRTEKEAAMADIADLIETRFGLATEAGRGRPAEGAVATALNHRSHRRYSDRPVDDETLVLLSAAFSAPPNRICSNRRW